MFKLDRNFHPTPADGEVKHGPYTLGHLAAWLETMPGDGEYCYVSAGACLIAQYFTAHNIAFRGVGGTYWRDENSLEKPLPPKFRAVAQGLPRTYSAALTRCRAAISAEKGGI